MKGQLEIVEVYRRVNGKADNMILRLSPERSFMELWDLPPEDPPYHLGGSLVSALQLKTGQPAKAG